MQISVIIATFNRGSLLRECLERLGCQRYEPGDEVIVVDNGSTDETPSILGDLAVRFPVPLRALHETTPGKTAAMNAGIAAARGHVLALTDDDVLVAETWLETIRDLFGDPDLALAGGRVEPRWEQQPPAWLQLERDGRYTRMASPLALQHYGAAQPLGHRTAVGANLAVRRDVLRAVGGFAPHLGPLPGTLLGGEDHDFCLRVVAAGFRAVYDPRLAVRHWVPKSRATVRYYLRWFFWSGVTNATIEGPATRGPRFLATPRYVWGQFVRGAADAVWHMAFGAPFKAAVAATNAAFAAGYIWKQVGQRNGWQEISSRHQQAPQLPAPAQSPALPIPGVETGKLDEMKATEPEQRRGQRESSQASRDSGPIPRVPAVGRRAG